MDWDTISIIVPLVLVLVVVAIVLVPDRPRRQRVRPTRRVPAGQDAARAGQGPGLVFLIPVVDRPVKVDVREQFIEIPSQTTITKDNAPIDIDFLIYWRIVRPARAAS